jgi:hypothetical protein
MVAISFNNVGVAADCVGCQILSGSQLNDTCGDLFGKKWFAFCYKSSVATYPGEVLERMLRRPPVIANKFLIPILDRIAKEQIIILSLLSHFRMISDY